MSEEVMAADSLMRANADLSRQIGELNTTIGYQDAMLRRAEADALALRTALAQATDDDAMTDTVQDALVELGVRTRLDTGESMREFCNSVAGEIIDAMRLRFAAARTVRTSDHSGDALLAELDAARALAAYLNDRRHWRSGICPTCGFGKKLDGSEFHGTGCPLDAYNRAQKASEE